MSKFEDRSKLLERVAKLLAMAKHSASNEHEASIALRRAESMMRQHDIQYAELNAQTLKSDDMVAAETGEGRNSKWIWNLAWAASYLTSTLPTKKRGQIKFCGTKEDTQVALLMFDYLVSVTERLAKTFDASRTERNSFKVGVVFAIVKRCRAIKAEREDDLSRATTGKDLVVVKKDLIAKQFNLSYSKGRAFRVSQTAYRAGYQKGLGVSLNDQVSHTARTAIGG